MCVLGWRWLVWADVIVSQLTWVHRMYQALRCSRPSRRQTRPKTRTCLTMPSQVLLARHWPVRGCREAAVAMANHSPPDEWYGIVLIPVYSSVRRYTLAILLLPWTIHIWHLFGCFSVIHDRTWCFIKLLSEHIYKFCQLSMSRWIYEVEIRYANDIGVVLPHISSAGLIGTGVSISL